MSQDRFSFLVTRKLSAEISADEDAELGQLLEQPGYSRQFELLRRFWEIRQSAGKPDIEKALSRVLKVIGEEKEEPEILPVQRKSPFRRLFVLVPLVLVAVVAGYFLIQQRQERAIPGNQSLLAEGKQTETVEKQNLKGTRSLITLADGSRVWLNADSKLKYPPAFNGQTREVELTGEAFFDVAKNKQKPFIIHMENGTVKVLGTSFNIKAYPGEQIVETSVVTGKVAFIPKKKSSIRAADTTFLTRDFKAVYTISTGIVKTMPTISIEDKAWTEGKLIFRGESMKEIATVLERSFGKEVIFDKDELMNYRLTGSFENNTLEEILYYLSHIKPFTYRITETQVLIYGMEDK